MSQLNQKIKFFQGDGDDLDAIHEQIAKWLADSNAIPTGLHSNVHFHQDDRKWYILVMISYQDGVARSGISVPQLIIPRRVD